MRINIFGPLYGLPGKLRKINYLITQIGRSFTKVNYANALVTDKPDITFAIFGQELNFIPIKYGFVECRPYKIALCSIVFINTFFGGSYYFIFNKINVIIQCRW